MRHIDRSLYGLWYSVKAYWLLVCLLIKPAKMPVFCTISQFFFILCISKSSHPVNFFSGGRRGSVSLYHILQFATGTPEEPILGFTLQPSIHFCEVKSSSGFIPTANTCINNMKLPRPSYEMELPSEEELFALYDYAFLNTFYGLF